MKSLTADEVERRLLREYLYLPGLSLSLAQAALLTGVDAAFCRLVLNQLVNARLLARQAAGRYVREGRYRDLDGWKDLVKAWLAAMPQTPPSPPQAVRSGRPQSGERRIAESPGPGR